MKLDHIHKPYHTHNELSHLPLREMLIPKKVQMPRDMVREATTVMNAVNPRPYFDLTRSILPAGTRTSTQYTTVVCKDTMNCYPWEEG